MYGAKPRTENERPMIRPTSTSPDELADELVALVEAGARLGLSPAGRSTDPEVADVLIKWATSAN